MKLKIVTIASRICFIILFLFIWMYTAGVFEEEVNDAMDLSGDWLVVVPAWYQTLIYWILPLTLAALILLDLRLVALYWRVNIWITSWILVFAWLKFVLVDDQSVIERADLARGHSSREVIIHLGWGDISGTVFTSITALVILSLCVVLYGLAMSRIRIRLG